MRKNEKKEVFASFRKWAEETASYQQAVQRFKSSNLSHQETSAGSPGPTRKTRPSRRGI